MKTFVLTAPVRFLLSGSIIVLTLLMASCSSTRNVVYLGEIKDSQLKSETSYANIEPVIQINDILSIVISSNSQEASAIFNAPNESTYNTSAASTANNRLTIGYLVDHDGNITFPILGKIHAAGLTKAQLTNYIVKELTDKQLLVNPIATIRMLNFRVSVLGEVSKPGVFTVPDERLNLLEALSFAGDITIYGKRDNVLLIRENDKGVKTFKRIDLTNPEILTSPYYYLRSNDIIYVEPLRNRLAKEKSAQTIPVVLSALSLIIIGITSFK